MLHTLCCAFFLLQQSPAAAPSVQDVQPAFGYDLRLGGAELLLGYRWNGGATVPLLSSGPQVRIEYGERGSSAHTRLYLPGNALIEAEASGASLLEAQGLAFDQGRFGSALRFAAADRLRLQLPPLGAPTHGWTLSFWVRPEPAGFGRVLALLPGAAEIALLGDGRVRAQLLPGGASLQSSARVVAGRWSFVVLAYDALLTRQARLVVDDLALNTSFPAPEPARVAAECQLGDVARNGQGFVGLLDELTLDSAPLSTAQALRAGRRELRPGSQSLELFTNLGLRTPSPAAGVTRDLLLDTPAELARGALAGVVLENGVLRWVPGRWQELETRVAPPPRTTHPLVSLGGQRLWTFGGETRDTRLWPMVNTADTWIFDGATGEWEQSPSTPAPSPRCHVPAAYSPDHDLVLLVGGWRNDVNPGQLMGDTWVYHVAERRWEQRFPGGDVFGGTLSDHSLVYLPLLQRFLLLRGQQNWLYDPLADRWQRLPLASAISAGGQPTSYSLGASHMHAVDAASGRVLLFGGSYGPASDIFSDTTAWYDVNTNVYTVLAPAQRPSARVRSAFAYDSRRGVFVLFGGVRDQFSLRHDDLWVFDPRTESWSEVGCSDRPGVRGGYYGMAYDEVGDRFLLYGGRSDPLSWLDDTRSLQLDPQRLGTALFTFDRLEDLGARRWFADVHTPGSSAVAFAFRTSDSGAEWGPWQPLARGFGHARFLQVTAILRPGALGEAPEIRRLGLRH